MSLRRQKNAEDSDKTLCKSIATSISHIIRYSFDEEFRRRSFKLFGVSSTKETEKEINKRLMSIVRSGRRNCDEVPMEVNNIGEDKMNMEVQNEPLEVEPNSFPGQNVNSQMLIRNHNIFKRNWLQVSSEQIQESIKRQKLNYYSQPQLIYHTRFSPVNCDFLNHNLHGSSSQPTDCEYLTSQLFCSDCVSSSYEFSDGPTNYWRHKFEESFKNNAHKYFKKNLKTEKQLSL